MSTVLTLETAKSLEILDSRFKEFPDLPSDQFSYKLAGGYGLDNLAVGDLDIDPNTMSMTIYFADGNNRDSVGDTLDISGIKTHRHVRNSIVLVDHGKTIAFPIARAREDPKDPNTYTVHLDAVSKKAWCRAFFYQGENQCALTGSCEPGTHSKLCEEIFDMCYQGFISGGSIGYAVIHATSLPPDYQTGTPQGLTLHSTLLLEVSLVVLPANELTTGKSSGAKSLYIRDHLSKVLTGGKINGHQPSEYFKKAFTPYVFPKKAQVIGGYRKDLEVLQLLHQVGEALSRHTNPAPMPGYGQMFLNGNDIDGHEAEVWYVGGDGDEDGFSDVVQQKIREAYPGCSHVHYEAEIFPPKSEIGWNQVYPEHKPWTDGEVIGTEPHTKAYGLRVPNYRKADDPEESCDTCGAYIPHGGQFGHCNMFDVLVDPEAVCDRWFSKSGEKSMQHGPNCKCAKCQMQYGKKDHHCGCKSCAEGKSCSCGVRTKAVGQGEGSSSQDEDSTPSSNEPQSPKPSAIPQQRQEDTTSQQQAEQRARQPQQRDTMPDWIQSQQQLQQREQENQQRSQQRGRQLEQRDTTHEQHYLRSLRDVGPVETAQHFMRLLKRVWENKPSVRNDPGWESAVVDHFVNQYSDAFRDPEASYSLRRLLERQIRELRQGKSLSAGQMRTKDEGDPPQSGSSRPKPTPSPQPAASQRKPVQTQQPTAQAAGTSPQQQGVGRSTGRRAPTIHPEDVTARAQAAGTSPQQQGVGRSTGRRAPIVHPDDVAAHAQAAGTSPQQQGVGISDVAGYEEQRQSQQEDEANAVGKRDPGKAASFYARQLDTVFDRDPRRSRNAINYFVAHFAEEHGDRLARVLRSLLDERLQKLQNRQGGGKGIEIGTKDETGSPKPKKETKPFQESDASKKPTKRDRAGQTRVGPFNVGYHGNPEKRDYSSQVSETPPPEAFPTSHSEKPLSPEEYEAHFSEAFPGDASRWFPSEEHSTSDEERARSLGISPDLLGQWDEFLEHISPEGLEEGSYATPEEIERADSIGILPSELKVFDSFTRKVDDAGLNTAAEFDDLPKEVKTDLFSWYTDHVENDPDGTVLRNTISRLSQRYSKSLDGSYFVKAKEGGESQKRPKKGGKPWPESGTEPVTSERTRYTGRGYPQSYDKPQPSVEGEPVETEKVEYSGRKYPRPRDRPSFVQRAELREQPTQSRIAAGIPGEFPREIHEEQGSKRGGDVITEERGFPPPPSPKTPQSSKAEVVQFHGRLGEMRQEIQRMLKYYKGNDNVRRMAVQRYLNNEVAPYLSNSDIRHSLESSEISDILGVRIRLSKPYTEETIPPKKRLNLPSIINEQVVDPLRSSIDEFDAAAEGGKQEQVESTWKEVIGGLDKVKYLLQRMVKQGVSPSKVQGLWRSISSKLNAGAFTNGLIATALSKALGVSFLSALGLVEKTAKSQEEKTEPTKSLFHKQVLREQSPRTSSEHYSKSEKRLNAGMKHIRHEKGRKEGHQWVLYNHDMSKVLGTHPSEEAAKKQEQAIKAHEKGLGIKSKTSDPAAGDEGYVGSTQSLSGMESSSRASQSRESDPPDYKRDDTPTARSLAEDAPSPDDYDVEFGGQYTEPYYLGRLEGYQARQSGLSRIQNPHPRGSTEYANWREGWDDQHFIDDPDTFGKNIKRLSIEMKDDSESSQSSRSSKPKQTQSSQSDPKVSRRSALGRMAGAAAAGSAGLGVGAYLGERSGQRQGYQQRQQEELGQQQSTHKPTGEVEGGGEGEGGFDVPEENQSDMLRRDEYPQPFEHGRKVDPKANLRQEMTQAQAEETGIQEQMRRFNLSPRNARAFYHFYEDMNPDKKERFNEMSPQEQKWRVNNYLRAQGLLKSFSQRGYTWDSKSLKDLIDKHRISDGRFHRSKHSIPGAIHMQLHAKDLDNLRDDARNKGVEVYWISDDGKGYCKVKLVGMDGVLEDLAKRYAKAIRKVKNLPNQQSKATNPIGTLPQGRSRSRASIQPQNLLPGGTREEEETSDETPVMTDRGTKAMKKTVTVEHEDDDGSGSDLQPNPKGSKHRQEDGRVQGEGVGEKIPGQDYTPGAEEQGSLDNSPTKGEPYGAQVLRRIHQDMAGLIHEYDEFLDQTEDDRMREIVMKQIHHFIDSLEELEDTAGTHERYKDIFSKSPLEGSVDDQGKKQLAMSGQSGVGFDSDLEGKPTLDQSLEGLETQEGSRAEPTPNEAMAGMRSPEEEEEEEEEEMRDLYHKHIKNLRHKHSKQYSKMEEKDKETGRHGHRKNGEGKSINGDRAVYLRKYLQFLGNDTRARAKKCRSFLIKKLKAHEEDKDKETLLQGRDKEHRPHSEEERHEGMDVTPKSGKKS